jgi:hypothetical protein
VRIPADNSLGELAQPAAKNAAASIGKKNFFIVKYLVN